MHPYSCTYEGGLEGGGGTTAGEVHVRGCMGHRSKVLPALILCIR